MIILFASNQLWVKVVILISLKELNTVGNLGINMPSSLTCLWVNWFLVTVSYSWEHSLFVETSWAMEVPYVNFYFGAWIYVFSDYFKVEPMHETFWVCVSFKVYIIFEIEIIWTIFDFLSLFDITNCQSCKCFYFSPWCFLDNS